MPKAFGKWFVHSGGLSWPASAVEEVGPGCGAPWKGTSPDFAYRRSLRPTIYFADEMGQMRILCVARRYWPALGGVETYLRTVATELAERHEVTVLAARIDAGPTKVLTDSLTPPPAFSPFMDGAVRVEPLVLSASQRSLLAPLVTQVVPGVRRYAHGRARRLMGKLYSRVVSPTIAIEANDKTIVHMWGSDFVAAAALSASRRVDKPFVVTPIAHPGQWGDDPLSISVYQQADGVIALLDNDSKFYESVGVASDKVHTLGICVPGLVPSPRGAIRERYRVNGCLILFLGDRRPYKGMDLLLAASAHLLDKSVPATIAFVGPGPALPVSAGLPVLDVGPVDEAGKAAWLRAADIVCLPSRSEGFGAVLLEAWSVEKPVVVSDIPALRELIAKSGGGLVAALDGESIAGALAKLIERPELRSQLGRAGFNFYTRHYTPESVARRHEELFRRILGEESHVS